MLEQGRGALQELDRAIVELMQRIGGLSDSAREEASEAQRILDLAVQEFEAATEGLRLSQEARDQRRDAVAHATGNLEARRKPAERLDPQAAERQVESIAETLAGMPIPAAPASEDDVETAESRVMTRRHAVADKGGDILRAQGGLEQVGGAVVREQKTEVDRALQMAQEQEHRVEVKYEAWRLLCDTLREVENSEGTHLGKALSGPLCERCRTLTGGRYGATAASPSGRSCSSRPMPSRRAASCARSTPSRSARRTSSRRSSGSASPSNCAAPSCSTIT